MKTSETKTIYTIGHSTRNWPEFLELLQSFEIQLLADIRTFPGSRRFPHFNQENLKKLLPQNGIAYQHLPGLGGRRKMKKDSQNNRWNNPSFRGYADYMETEDFETAVSELEKLAAEQITVYMCSEAVWWRCHRSMVSDYLKARGWEVLHIMAKDTVQPHKYTAPARLEDGKVFYSDKDLFSE